MNDADVNNMLTVTKACKGFEPIEALQLNELTARGIEVTAMVSIAISLKRIADSMDKINVERLKGTAGGAGCFKEVE